MKRILFITSTMPEESRVALTPNSLKKIHNKDYVFIQKGYARHLGDGYQSSNYKGIKEMELQDSHKADIIITPKRSRRDASLFGYGKTFGGWLYVSQTPWLANVLINNNMNGLAFEKMYKNDNDYVFAANREITGRVGMEDALTKYESIIKRKRNPQNIAVIGNGNVGSAAIKLLEERGLRYSLFRSNNSSEFFRGIGEFDVVVNCIKWDHSEGHFIRKEDIEKMQKGCYIVDLSSEGIEGSEPKSIHNPIHELDKVFIYNNEHIPTLVPRESSEVIGAAFAPFVDGLITENHDSIIDDAYVVGNGQITDMRIGSLIKANRRYSTAPILA